jgi:hypothetical protein
LVASSCWVWGGDVGVAGDGSAEGMIIE